MNKKYSTIVIDPPWQYGKWSKSSSKAASRGFLVTAEYELPYKYLTLEEIKKLELNDLMDDNCDVYLWTTQKYLPESFKIINSWGLKYCQTLVWCKTPRGTGQGGVYTPNTEFLILARKGKMPHVKRVDSTWWNVKRQKKHSQKPEFFQDMIEMVSNAPRLELFARRKRKGWDVWGDEVECDLQFNNYPLTTNVSYEK